MPTQQALTPMVLPPALLPRGLAFSSAGAQGAIVAGPALGGFVYVAGADVVYAVCALLFVDRRRCSPRGVRYEQPARVKKAITIETLLAGVRFVARPARPSSARSRSTCSPCSSAARPRCCRSSRATCCTSAPGASACCAPRPRPARSPRRSLLTRWPVDAARRPRPARRPWRSTASPRSPSAVDLVRAFARRARRLRRAPTW